MGSSLSASETGSRVRWVQLLLPCPKDLEEQNQMLRKSLQIYSPTVAVPSQANLGPCCLFFVLAHKALKRLATSAE